MTASVPVVHPSAWLGPAIAADPSWSVTLTSTQQDEIRQALARAKAGGHVAADLTPSNFALPASAALLRETGDALRDGRGFVLLRGFPVDGIALPDIELAFLGFCTHLGTAVTQNAAGEFLAHITDKGPLTGAMARGYATANEAKFHIDLTDVVGLLCLRQAREGGHSRISSSVAVLNVVMREHPEYLPLLRVGFPWDRRDEHGAGEAPIGPRIPLFSEVDGVWTCRYNRGFIEAAYRRRGETMPQEQKAALDFVDAVAAREDLVLDMDFQPGDVQLLSNDTILHARTAFKDFPEHDRKRLLLRIWLQMHTPRPLADPAVMRDAFVRYGNLGKSAQEWLTAKADGATGTRATMVDTTR